MNLSRAHRPQRFAEITDQEPIKETLRKEVESGKLAHAYLFGGPRGVGKTTAARIFAKALNCLTPVAGEPCTTCAKCLEFSAGTGLDIMEMDAASNTGVDNVREAIIEHVRFAPTGSKHKVYILDEAHMLSTSAWNALLKTLEEPPSYAIFILITTELHKVPATIQSRCQRFDFKRVSDDKLAERIKSLSLLEKITIDQAVVDAIVSKADGCVRDAESLLGQLCALGESHLTAAIAEIILPASRLPLAAEVLKIWSSRQLGAATAKVGEIEDQGIPFLPLFDDMIEAIRHLLLASDSVEWRQRLANGDEGMRTLATLVTVYEPAELADMALMLMERRRDAKQGADARFCLELAAAAVALGILPHGPSAASTLSSSEARTNIIRSVPAAAPAYHPPAPIASSPKPIPPAPVIIATPVSFTSSPQPVTSTDAPHLSLNQIQAKWPTFIRNMDAKSPSLTFVLRISRPVAVENHVVMLGFQYAYHREKLITDLKARRLIEDCMRETYANAALRVDGNVTAPGTEPEKKEDMVNTILKAFGGNLVEEGGTSTTP